MDSLAAPYAQTNRAHGKSDATRKLGRLRNATVDGGFALVGWGYDLPVRHFVLAEELKRE